VTVPGKFPLSILVGMAAMTWFLVAVGIFGAPASSAFFKPMSIVVAILTGVLAGWDRWVWRIPRLSLVHGVPNLNGTWKGQLTSLWTDPETGEVPAPIPIVFVVRQTYTSVTVRTFTEESTSVSVAAGLTTEPDGRHVLAAMYRNEPKLTAQERSRPHHGGVRLAVSGNEDKLEGHYWTDRGTSGEMMLVRAGRKHVLDYAAGVALGAGEVTKRIQGPASGKGTR
jgi:hypothetical protein